MIRIIPKREWFAAGVFFGVFTLLAGCGQSNPGSSSAAGGGSSTSSTQSGPSTIINGCNTGAKPFGAGDGSAGNPYLICTIAQFNSMANATYFGSNFQLATNLDATSATLYMIPQNTAVFDGHGMTISNWSGYGPLFESNAGTVKNLALTNINIIGSWRSGLVGTNLGTGQISGCSVQGKINSPYMSGGVVGLNLGTISNSNANVAIQGDDHIGGLVGDNQGTISGSTSSGSIIPGTMFPETNSIMNNLYFGGLVGISDSGSITQSSSSMTIQGAGDLGGLIGTVTTGTVSESFATGRVVGTGANVGGLIGLDSGSTLSNSYATGAVQGGSQVGGLEGSTAGSVSYCLSTGTVSGGAGAGGLIGAVSGSGNATDSFWDTTASGLSTSAAGTGEVTASLEAEATYTGWNFSSIWNAPSGGYPTLQQ